VTNFHEFWENLNGIGYVKKHLLQQWCIDIYLAIIYIPYLSFLKAKWNGNGIGSMEKSASIKAICLLNIWIMQNNGLND
jgi:hypothetical protein